MSTVICRAEDSCEAGVHWSPGHASGGPDTGVFDKHSSTIIILVQWSWTELSKHPRRDLNSRCAFVYALSPNFSGKLVVSASCRASFPWCYLCWSLGDDYRGRPAHTNSECEGRIDSPRRRMLRDDMLAPSTITFHIVVAMFETICRITPCQDLRITLHLLTKL